MTAPATPLGHPHRRRSVVTVGVIALWAFGTLAAAPGVAAETLSDVFDRVYRSVVVIRALERDIPEDREGSTSIASFGSGVVVSADGLIMTAAHLVQAASVVRVKFATGSSVPARIVASEPSADVSLLKVERVA